MFKFMPKTATNRGGSSSYRWLLDFYLRGTNLCKQVVHFKCCKISEGNGIKTVLASVICSGSGNCSNKTHQNRLLRRVGLFGGCFFFFLLLLIQVK